MPPKTVAGYVEEDVVPSSEESDRETTSTESEDDDVQEPHSPDHQDKRDPSGDHSPHDPDASGSATNFASTEGLLVVNTNDDKVEDFIDEEFATLVESVILSKKNDEVKKLLNEAKSKAKFYATMFQRLSKENKTYETEKKKEESKAKKKEKQEAEKAERAENRSKIITINVSTGGGETKPLKVRAGMTMKEVKDLIHQTFFSGLSEKAFKSVQLVYGDKTLTDHPRRELNFYKLPDGINQGCLHWRWRYQAWTCQGAGELGLSNPLCPRCCRERCASHQESPQHHID